MHAESALVQTQRVDIGHQVAAIAIRRDQLDDASVLVQGRVRVVGAPTHRLVGDPEFKEDVVEEVVGEQQFVDGPEEVAGLRALDDPVVVGRCQRDNLADAEFGDALLAGALELRRQFHRADANDGALACHQSRHRVHGADGPRVGQRDGDAGEILGGELAVSGATHDVLVGRDELTESHCLATLDGGDDQGAFPVFAGQVDRQAQICVPRGDRVGLAVDLGEVAVHVGELLDCLDDRVPEQVGKGDLAAAGALEMVVGDDPVIDHQFRRDRPNAGGGRDLQRDVHVLHYGGRGPAQHLRVGAGGFRRYSGRGNSRGDGGSGGRHGDGGSGGRLGGGGRGGGGGGRGRLRVTVCGRVAGGVWAVSGEELVPTLVDGGGVFAEFAVHLLDQPLVLAEW